MRKLKRIVQGLFVVIYLLGLFTWGKTPAHAQNPIRQTKLLVPFTQYEWWMMDWETNKILCQVFIEHSGLPTSNEVAKSCGKAQSTLWLNTPPCDVSKQDTICQGVYLHLVSTQAAQKEVIIDLPAPVIWVELEGCTPLPPENRCPSIPFLKLTAEEPIPSEQITSIQGLYDGEAFQCPGSECLVQLRATPLLGSTIEFWANSSFGDTSEHYVAQVRVLDTGVSAVPGNSGWYVDVISPQWKGSPIASCSRIWEAFPPVGQPPTWLSTPERSELIASNNLYFYLAGRLIAQGQVSALDCPSGGLLSNGYANTCGIERARPLLVEWQNQFDKQIILTAQEIGVPAQLMKNLFAQESQFWPGVYRVRYELGLGQITDNGVDAIFLWNSEFYNQFCVLVLSETTCNKGYLYLSQSEKDLLRGALASQAGVDCPTCPAGINLAKAEESVGLFAQTLVANCSQVNQTIYTATQLKSGLAASYEDLWRFTIANYHAGPGCLAFAIHTAWQGLTPLTWDQVSQFFTPACQGVVAYVNDITR